MQQLRLQRAKPQGFVAVFVLALLVAAPGTPAAAQAIRTINAEYDVRFNGVSIGYFEFRNKMSGQRYSATSSAKGRLLFGALKWTGAFAATGKIVSDVVYPRSYSQRFESRRRLAFRTKRKRKTAKVTFDRSGNASAKLQPPLKTHERVPLKPQHKRGAFDPISAIIAMTQTNVNRPCRGRLPVFEGRQRFDIVLGFKRRKNIRDARGRSHRGYVCSVRYVPIAGHRLKDANSDMAKPGAIELVLREVRAAEVLVPHALRISTRFGSAAMVARKIDIRTNGRGRIVLKN